MRTFYAGAAFLKAAVQTHTMRQLVLHEGTVSIELVNDGRLIYLNLRNSEHVQFILSRSTLEGVLRGETVQISHRGVFCKMTRSSDSVSMLFAWKTRHEHASFQISDLETFLEPMEV